MNFPSKYITRSGEEVTILGTTPEGNYIGALKFVIYDKNFNAIEPKDKNLDLVEWSLKQRKELSK